ncbi:tetratricopeptide repeat protein [Myroides indicus]|uniref:tetratricopeptide repeat protein n=1 Tax=Myroides indicus TaxID=1323422 RepID=UPI001FBB7079|nr:tetratricopeptide repeat protein [Myroides indicus]
MEAKLNYEAGLYYSKTNQYAKSVDYLLKALGGFKKYDRPDGVAYTMNSLGSIYYTLGEKEMAASYYDQSSEIFLKRNDSLGLAVYYANVNKILLEEGKDDLARTQLKKAVRIFEKYHSYENEIIAIMFLGDLEIHAGNTAFAREYLDRAYKKSKDYFKNKIFQGHILLHYGHLYKDQKQTDKAIEYYHKGINIAGDAHIDQIALKQLSDLYIAQKKYEKGNYYLAKYYQVSDSLKGATVKSEIEGIRWNSEIKEQKYKNQLLNIQYEIEKQKRLNQTKTSIIIIFAVVGAIVVVSLLYRNKKRAFYISELEKKGLLEKIKSDEKIKKMHQEKYEYELDKKNQELVAINVLLLSKNQFLAEIEKVLEHNKNIGEIENELKKAIRKLNIQEKGWEQFKSAFEKVHPLFFKTIQTEYPQLSKTEIRICSYIKINMSNQEIAALLNIEYRSVIVARSRIRKKLNLKQNEELDELIKLW